MSSELIGVICFPVAALQVESGISTLSVLVIPVVPHLRLLNMITPGTQVRAPACDYLLLLPGESTRMDSFTNTHLPKSADDAVYYRDNYEFAGALLDIDSHSHCRLPCSCCSTALFGLASRLRYYSGARLRVEFAKGNFVSRDSRGPAKRSGFR
jgi:hypothetical protein